MQVIVYIFILYNTPKRLQRMLLWLKKYNRNVKYCLGKEMFNKLSHAFLKEKAPSNSSSEYQIFQLRQEAQLYKEIEDINPVDYVTLNEEGLKW